MTIDQTTTPVEIGVCEFLKANPNVEAVVGQVLEEYIRASKLHQFPVDVVHAAAIVSEEAGELVKAANDTHYYDCPAHRQNLNEEAVQTGAMAIWFLENIGNLKGRE